MDCLNNSATSGIPLVLVGNKIDLTEERVISSDKGQALANLFTDGNYFE